MRSTNNCESSKGLLFFQELSSPHINQIDFSSIINNGVFWLDISVNNILGMKMLNRQQYRGKKVSCNRFIKRRKFSNNTKKLNTLQILHQEVNILFIGKSFNKPNDKGKLYFLQDPSLLINIGLETFLLDKAFRYLFQCVHSLHSGISYKLDCPKLPFA